MLHWILIHVHVVLNAVQRMLESEGSDGKLQSFFRAPKPRASDQLFSSSERASLSRASLEWNVLAQACFHKSFSFFCPVYSSVRSEVALLRIGGGGVGLMGEVCWWWWRGVMIFTSATGSSLHPYISLLLPSLACSCSSLLLPCSL